MLAIIDYGIGNIRSVRNALDHLGIPAIISRDPAELRRVDALLLPGVGAFGEGMARIETYGLHPLLKKAGFRIKYVNFWRHPDLTVDVTKYDGLIVLGGPMGVYEAGERPHLKFEMDCIRQAIAENKPVLGICLGFELLMLSSDEMGRHEGLGYVRCPVSRLPVEAKLPHIGWSRVATGPASPQPCRLLRGLEGESFYFVHSYGVHGDMGGDVHATASYGGLSLMALVEKGSVFGTQFHPEKSGEAGLELLRNFSRLY